MRNTPAIRLVMGHAGTTIDDIYHGRIADNRLPNVTHIVRYWLLKESLQWLAAPDLMAPSVNNGRMKRLTKICT
jgi:hypothetical protein